MLFTLSKVSVFTFFSGTTNGFIKTKPACNVNATPARRISFFEAGVRAITLENEPSKF